MWTDSGEEGVPKPNQMPIDQNEVTDNFFRKTLHFYEKFIHMQRREVRGWLYQFVPPVHRPLNLEENLREQNFDGSRLAVVTKEELIEIFGFSDEIATILIEERVKKKVILK